MDILRTKDKILAALGNIRAMERLHVDTFTENKIKNISGIKIAESKEGQFWIKHQELNGFMFMNSTILSRNNLKTSKGAKLVVFTDDYEITMDSDEFQIESDFSNVSNTWITKVSFVIESREKDIIASKKFEEIEYHYEKMKLKFIACK